MNILKTIYGWVKNLCRITVVVVTEKECNSFDIIISFDIGLNFKEKLMFANAKYSFIKKESTNN